MGIKEDVEKIEKKMKTIEHESFAMEMLKDQRKQNKRLFIIWIVTFIAFIGLLGYTIWLLNDIGTIEEITRTQEIHDLESIEYSDIINGDYYGEDQADY